MRAVVGLALALAATSCSSKAREPTVHRVEIRGMLFVPFELEVRVGDRIEWTNHDVVPHTVTSAVKATPFDSGNMVAKATWSWTATSAGELPYVCTLHPTMRGKLVVR